MTGEKTSKIQEIKETVSCTVEIIRQIKAPGMHESFGKIITTGIIVRDIIEALKTPEMIRNIENFRVISENINESTTKIHNTAKLLEETGVVKETKEFVQSAKHTMNLLGDSSHDLREMSRTLNAMLKSVKVLVDGLKN
jgi:Ribonuclease G/E